VAFGYAGYFFGELPAVRENFTLLILGIIVVSVLPVVFEAWKAWRGRP
jgi:membrane-associated protein